MKHIKEVLVGMFVGLIIGVLFLTVNYYSNQEKDAHYAEIYGHSQVQEKEVKVDE